MARARRTVVAVLGILVTATVPACGRGGGANLAALISHAGSTQFVPVDPSSSSPTDRAIADAQARIVRDPADRQALLDLAQAYLQKARERADPSLYNKTAGILAALEKVEPGDLGLLVTDGTLANARHRFSEALRLGQEATRLAPASEAAWGVVVDSANELGRYDESVAATQKMADLRGDLPALSRVSYARELRGDLDGAITAMTEAVTAGGTQGGENVAYVDALLGNLLLTSGRVQDAEEYYDDALAAFPGLAAAEAGQAQVLVAEGKPAQAAALLDQVVRVQPLAQYAISEGDDYSAAGEPDRAAEAYALVRVIERLYAANGVDVDLELALFDADHSPGPAALAEARRGYEARPSYLGHEVVAWNLYRLGQTEAAGREISSALALGDRDPMLRFHAAVNFEALGMAEGARENLEVVLSENPRFSALYEGWVASLAARYGLSVSPPAVP
jgi:tetratricopeptide (TPR) repeat protein